MIFIVFYILFITKYTNIKQAQSFLFTFAHTNEMNNTKKLRMCAFLHD